MNIFAALSPQKGKNKGFGSDHERIFRVYDNGFK
jgi:hypothetical protein